MEPISANNSIHRLKSSLKLSSVVPATVTGGVAHELTDMDLAMKLHYIKGVYFFNRDAVEGIAMYDLKKPTFPLLQLYFHAAGRIRRSETGRPFITCNDSGVRIVEASCEQTVEEWLSMAVEDDSAFDCLAYNKALGDLGPNVNLGPDSDPDLGFSPLIFLQFTWFKCGGMSLGMSWAHVLGDAYSASAFINLWGKIMAGLVPHKSHHHIPDSATSELPLSVPPKLTPNALKRVDSVGDLWLAPNNCKMKTHTFLVPANKITRFLSDLKSIKVSAFEVLSALIWKSMSKINENPKETRMITLCTNKSHKKEFEFPSNGMAEWSTVEADFSVAEAEVLELVELIVSKKIDENDMIREMMGNINYDSEELSSDFIAYGANLTFVNLEEAEIYGLELKGKRPVYANYAVGGVGDKGVVLVLPGPNYGNKGDGITGDRTVTVVLPENQLQQLKVELKRNWCIT